MTTLILLVVGVIAWRAFKKAQERKQEQEELKLWLEHKRLMAQQQAHVGEVVEPGQSPPHLANTVHAQASSHPNWKTQMAVAGAKMLLGAIFGHRHHNNHNHRHHS